VLKYSKPTLLLKEEVHPQNYDILPLQPPCTENRPQSKCDHTGAKPSRKSHEIETKKARTTKNKYSIVNHPIFSTKSLLEENNTFSSHMKILDI
jgi:hypothetical protein